MKPSHCVIQPFETGAKLFVRPDTEPTKTKLDLALMNPALPF